MAESKKKKEFVVNVPEMAEYFPPSSLNTTNTSIEQLRTRNVPEIGEYFTRWRKNTKNASKEPLRTNRTPNWDGVTGMKELYIVRHIFGKIK